MIATVTLPDTLPCVLEAGAENRPFLRQKPIAEVLAEIVYRNSVYQLTSSWWVAGKFLDVMRLDMGFSPLLSEKGNDISMRDGEPIPLSLLQAEMVRGQRTPQMIPFHVARGGRASAMSDRGARKCQIEALELAKAQVCLVRY